MTTSTGTIRWGGLLALTVAIASSSGCANATAADICQALDDSGCLERDGQTYEGCLTINQSAADDYTMRGCGSELQVVTDCVVGEISATNCEPITTGTCGDEAATLRACLM